MRPCLKWAQIRHNKNRMRILIVVQAAQTRNFLSRGKRLFGKNQIFSGTDNELFGQDKASQFRTIQIIEQTQPRFNVNIFFLSSVVCLDKNVLHFVISVKRYQIMIREFVDRIWVKLHCPPLNFFG